MHLDAAQTRLAVLASPLWQDRDLWRVWCWALLRAARRAHVADVGGVPVRLAAGELAAPLAQVCAETGLGPDVLRAKLTIGKDLGLLEVRPVLFGLRIAVVDWQYIGQGDLGAAAWAGPARLTWTHTRRRHM